MANPNYGPQGGRDAVAAQQAAAERQRPSGWPVGSFHTYAEAQQAVDMLSDRGFPVEQLTIVGVDLLQVENVTGRLTWPKVLGGGALSGGIFGLFVGLLLSLFSPGFILGPLVVGVVIGVIFGLIFSAIPYGMSQGKRDFTSATTIVAGRYDVLCAPANAEEARDLIANSQRTQTPPVGDTPLAGPGAEQVDREWTGRDDEAATPSPEEPARGFSFGATGPVEQGGKDTESPKAESGKASDRDDGNSGGER